MKVKSFYKTQKEVATIFNYLVDKYWIDEITEKYFFETIVMLCENNESLIFKNTEFTCLIQQHCGKRRLDIIHKIISNNKVEV